MDGDVDMDRRDERDKVLMGLPDDLALQCLARLPRAQLHVCTLVSRAWKQIIQDKYTDIVEMRRSFGIFEDWPVVLIDGPRETGRVWRALDPVTLRWNALPDLAAEEAFHSADKECFVAGRNLLVVGIQSRMEPPLYRMDTDQEIWYYDVDMGTWSRAPGMRVKRCLFASASTGIYGYVAGGTILGTQARPCNIAERFNSVTMSWEELPNMRVERKDCSGFIMDDRFYVISGLNSRGEQHSHGEFYDPETNAWTIVGNLWPREMPRQIPAGGAPPLVAVLENELYALDAAINELKHYNKVTGIWTTLTAVPGRGVEESGWGLAFKALGGELWVIGGRSPARQNANDIVAFKPDPVHGQHTPWRRVTNTFNGGGFCLNCAVMKM